MLMLPWGWGCACVAMLQGRGVHAMGCACVAVLFFFWKERRSVKFLRFEAKGKQLLKEENGGDKRSEAPNNSGIESPFWIPSQKFKNP